MASCQYWHANYFYITMYADIVETGSNYHKVHWKLVMHHSRLNVSSFSFNWYVNDNSGVINYGAINAGRGGQDRTLGEGTVTVWHTDAVNIGFGFSSGIRWKDYTSGGYLAYDPSANGSITLPQLAVAPTPPNSVSVSGGSSGWLSINNPTFNVSWSGASAGTYTITQYNIDVTKNDWASITTPASLSTSNTYGSLNNVSASSLGLSGGETVRVRVAMMTSRGDWLLSYWGGSFRTYSNPTSPTTFNVPSSQEIDTAFNITWSGASAGSNGIAGYDLEIRAYNGSSWTDWVRLWNCVNKTSYSSGSPKSLSVNGVSYANNGENVQFQYRLRTSDGTIATSDWVVKTMKIFINSPTDPRK